VKPNAITNWPVLAPRKEKKLKTPSTAIMAPTVPFINLKKVGVSMQQIFDGASFDISSKLL